MSDLALLHDVGVVRHRQGDVDRLLDEQDRGATVREGLGRNGGLLALVRNGSTAGARQGGLGAIGTPEDVIAQIDRLMEQSNGGFGSYLMLAHEWANTEATRRSYELIAKYVMPEFQGQAHATRDAVARAKKLRDKLKTEQQAALDAATEKHAAEVASLEQGKSAG